ncbi:uncharacterized protein DMAD_03382 [Drosophila madeirensis]|uniref:Uncharacterized protein n=1 Tax=Drosophila madeirensis TaxID=30013 RepID=A0AAU9GA18_DROMD
MDLRTLRTIFLDLDIFRGRESDINRTYKQVRRTSQEQQLAQSKINRFGDLEDYRQPFFLVMDEYHFSSIGREDQQELPTIEAINPPANVHAVHVQELTQIQDLLRRKLALDGIPFSLAHFNSGKHEVFGQSLRVNILNVFRTIHTNHPEIMSHRLAAIQVFSWVLSMMVSLTDPRD